MCAAVYIPPPHRQSGGDNVNIQLSVRKRVSDGLPYSICAVFPQSHKRGQMHNNCLQDRLHWEHSAHQDQAECLSVGGKFKFVQNILENQTQSTLYEEMKKRQPKWQALHRRRTQLPVMRVRVLEQRNLQRGVTTGKDTIYTNIYTYKYPVSVTRWLHSMWYFPAHVQYVNVINCLTHQEKIRLVSRLHSFNIPQSSIHPLWLTVRGLNDEGWSDARLLEGS